MALGQIFTIANGTARLVVAQSHTEVPSVGVLNPNDGVAYLKLNGPAGSSPPEWDWKLPSQSYGYFPGPWTSLGIYFSDQSGSNRSGDINVYESQQQFADIPQIAAIGRAVAAAGSAVDISQGNQPANPPASTGRLWIDGTGHLHVLQSNGTDYLQIDSNNIGSQTLGGDLNGSIANGHVNGLTISGGNWTIAGTTHVGDLYATRGASSGALFLGSDGIHYLYFDGANYQLAGSGAQLHLDGGQVTFVDAAHSIVNSGGNMIHFCGAGAFFFWTVSSTYAQLNTGTIVVQSGNITISSGRLYLEASNQVQVFYNGTYGGVDIPYGNGLITGYLTVRNTAVIQTGLSMPSGNCYIGGNYTAQGVGSGGGYAFQTANAAAAYGQGYANAWINASSIDFKKNIRSLRDPLSIVMNDSLHGIEYDHDWELPSGSNGAKVKASGRAHSIGFVADYWLPFVPEVVSVDEYGKAQGMDYSRVTAIVFQALKEYVTTTNKRLDKLEKV